MADAPFPPSLVPFEALKVISGYQQAGAIERWACEQSIKLFYGRNGPWTTIEIINAAAGIFPGRGIEKRYERDMF